MEFYGVCFLNNIYSLKQIAAFPHSSLQTCKCNPHGFSTRVSFENTLYTFLTRVSSAFKSHSNHVMLQQFKMMNMLQNFSIIDLAFFSVMTLENIPHYFLKAANKGLFVYWSEPKFSTYFLNFLSAINILSKVRLRNIIQVICYSSSKIEVGSSALKVPFVFFLQVFELLRHIEHGTWGLSLLVLLFLVCLVQILKTEALEKNNIIELISS